MIIFCGLSLSFLNLFAQEEELSEAEKASQLKLQQDVLKYKELETKLLEEAYEKAIDPETYLVGPGDYFSIVIWGDIQKGFQLPVTPEGMLIIPTVGILKVDGLTLKATQEMVEKAAMAKYKQTRISTNLMAMRKLRVHVTGEVINPGTYIATPIDRMSDLIYRAGGLKTYAYLQEIYIKHLSGEETRIDFSGFQEQGDLSQNPFVCGGDIILINPIDYSRPMVKVEGYLRQPQGFYPLKAGESIFEFLSRHNLLDRNQKFSQVVIQRGKMPLIQVDLTSDAAHKTKLENGDLLILPLDIRMVYIAGAVQTPGLISYLNTFRAKDYVGRSGITADAAGLNSILVRHLSLGKIEKGGDAQVYPGDVIEVPVRRSKRISEYLQITGQLATIIIAYFAIKK